MNEPLFTVKLIVYDDFRFQHKYFKDKFLNINFPVYIVKFNFILMLYLLENSKCKFETKHNFIINILYNNTDNTN